MKYSLKPQIKNAIEQKDDTSSGGDFIPNEEIIGIQPPDNSNDHSLHSFFMDKLKINSDIELNKNIYRKWNGHKDKFNYKNLQLNINFINTDFNMIDMEGKGLGFVNVGNICHANSFIQVFSFSNTFYWRFFDYIKGLIEITFRLKFLNL